jgi:hypothetical protein
LIRDNGQLTPDEIEHLTTCASCNKWLTRFTKLARDSGFKISFVIPPGPPRKNSEGGSQGSEVA